MEQRLSIISLGVADLARSRRFYVDGLGWTPAIEMDEIIFFQVGGLVVGLFPGLAQDAGVEGEGRPTGGLMALAHNVRTREEVDPLVEAVAAAGAVVTREAQDLPWGGRSAYFTDPDGHLWEIAWNPAWPIDEEGRVRIPS